MRIAVLADIHSNHFALNKVIEEMGVVEQTWVLGDLFGYGPHPIQVWQKLRDRNKTIFIRGNHDEVLGTGNLAVHLNADVSNAISKNKAAFDGNLINVSNFIKSMPYICSPLPGVYISHGAANLNDMDNKTTALTLYPENNKNIEFMMQSFGSSLKKIKNFQWVTRIYEHPEEYCPPKLILMGHTHLKLLKYYSYVEEKVEDMTLEFPEDEDSITIKPVERTSMCTIVVPGSVGVPREGGPCDANNECWANYVILNINEFGICESLEYHRTKYSAKPVADALKAYGYPKKIVQFFNKDEG